MSSIRGTTSSGSSTSRALNSPSTEPAFAALAGPVTSFRGKRSNVGSGADGKVAPSTPYLTPGRALDQAGGSRIRKHLLIPLFRQHHRRILQLPAHALARPEDPPGHAHEARLVNPLQPQLLLHVARTTGAGDRKLVARLSPVREIEPEVAATACLVRQLTERGSRQDRRLPLQHAATPLPQPQTTRNFLQADLVSTDLDRDVRIARHRGRRLLPRLRPGRARRRLRRPRPLGRLAREDRVLRADRTVSGEAGVAGKEQRACPGRG